MAVVLVSAATGSTVQAFVVAGATVPTSAAAALATINSTGSFLVKSSSVAAVPASYIPTTAAAVGMQVLIGCAGGDWWRGWQWHCVAVRASIAVSIKPKCDICCTIQMFDLTLASVTSKSPGNEPAVNRSTGKLQISSDLFDCMHTYELFTLLFHKQPSLSRRTDCHSKQLCCTTYTS